MTIQLHTNPTVRAAPSFIPIQNRLLQRKCACGGTPGSTGECEACRQNREAVTLQRTASHAAVNPVAPPIVHEVLRAPGQPLDVATRAQLEPRFGHDFSQVRVHTDSKAAASAQAVNALAYTVGRSIVFGAGMYATDRPAGRRLLAHELAHTVQQQHQAANGSNGSLTLDDPHSPAEREADQVAAMLAQGKAATPMGRAFPRRVARFCTPAATCSPATPIPGSAEDFGTGEVAIEAGPRARRKRMTATRARSTGHGGRALQLERFLNGQDPTRLANIQGIFIDQDMSPGTGALTQSCAAWIADSLPAGAPTPPGMAGAVKQCTFVHGNLNQEALIFNTSTAPTIGGRSRERWRIDTLQTLTHETEHPRFEAATAGAPLPVGVTSPTCTRTNVLSEISEIAAGLSEFLPLFRPAAAEANPAGPLHTRLAAWFHEVAVLGGENFKGAMTKMGCSCNCSEVDAHVRTTFAEVTASNGWTAAERTAFNTQMRLELPVGPRPSWPL